MAQEEELCGECQHLQGHEVQERQGLNQLQDAKEYLQAPNTRLRFMTIWQEQAWGSSGCRILIPRKVAQSNIYIGHTRGSLAKFSRW